METKEGEKSIKKHGFIKKLLISIAVCFLLFSVAGFFILPPILKSTLTQKLSENLGRQVTIGEIKFNPYKFHLAVLGVIIKEEAKSDTFFSFDELFISIEPTSFFRQVLIVKELRLKKPFLNFVRNQDGSYNISDILAKGKSTSAEPPQPRSKILPRHFSLNNISITDGNIDFLDVMKDTKHTVKDMNVTIPFISNSPKYIDYYVLPAFSANINGAPYSLQGQTEPFAESLETYLDINIKDFNIPYYLAYSPVKMNFSMPSGILDMVVRVSFIRSNDKTPALSINGTIILKNIVLNDAEKNRLLDVPRATMEIASIEPLLQTVKLSLFALESPKIMVRREKTGKINFESLVTPEKGELKKGTTKQIKEENPLQIFIEKIDIKNGNISFHDNVPPDPVNMQLSNIVMKMENVSTEKDKKSSISLTSLLNKKGNISIEGAVTINPVSAHLSLDLKRLAIKPFQTYFTDTVNINITDGIVSLKGKVVASERKKNDFTAKFNGNVLVSSFASSNKEDGEPFLNWKTFSFSSVNAGHNPFYAHIDGISISDFYARITINPDGTLNLLKVLKEDEKQKTTSTPPPPERVAGTKEERKPEADIEIGSITVQGGTIDFSDRLIKPRFSTNLTEMGGRISGISMNRDQMANLDVKGKINQYIPIGIAGKFNPSKERLFADLTVKLNDFDLSPATPYSGKYLGYKVEKGKLSLDLKYLIDKRKLESKNVIFIDQLTLGEQVKSPDATKLPVRLAIALLKDRNGQIKLDIPVSGSLDDPKFSVWRIVFKILVNLIAKAATSPFALLGSLFGGGDELSYLEFDYGSDKVADAGQKKMTTLVKALYDRPSLRVDVEGHVDMEKDREGLRNYILNRKIKTQKLNDMIKKGRQTPPADDIIIDQKEYEKYLTMAYKADKFAKPKNFIGLAKTLPVPEMEKLMLTNTEIKEDDLRSLAERRSLVVKNSLLKSGQITPDRIFVVEPKSLVPEKKEKLKNSRVDFRLR